LNYTNLGHAQTLLLKVSALRNLDLLLQAELSMGVADLYRSALNSLGRQETKDGNIILAYLNNRICYNIAKAYEDMQKITFDEFKKTGMNYGHQISYLKVAIGYLESGLSEKDGLEGLINLNDYMRYGEELSTLMSQLKDTNHKIYCHAIPEEKYLPPIEKKIKIAAFEDTDGIGTRDDFLDALVPKGKSEEIEKLKRQLIDFITTGLNKYQKAEDIDTFLKAEGLSYDINEFLDNDPLLVQSDFWKKFSDIKINGSIDYFVNSLFCYQSIHDEIQEQILGVFNKLYVR
jgi:hypothetical protein